MGRAFDSLGEDGVEVSAAEQEATAVTVRVQPPEGDEVIDPADRTRQILGGALDTEPGLPHPARLRGLVGLLLEEPGDALGDRVQDSFRDCESKSLGHMN